MSLGNEKNAKTRRFSPTLKLKKSSRWEGRGRRKKGKDVSGSYLKEEKHGGKCWELVGG